ncbi:unnamed protein product [Closterium sp. NIES-54]
MYPRLLVSGLPRSLPYLPRLPAPSCLPCVKGRQRAAPHSSEFSLTTAPLQTLHMDMWDPTPVGGMDQERYFLLVVDDYTHYTTVFPLRRKADVSGVLIPWIRATRRQLRERFRWDLPVLRLHSDRGGEFSSGLLEDFGQDDCIHQTFTLAASPQQNGIGLIMEVARTSMIHAAAPHFLWPFAVQYAAHQLNLCPRVSEPETSPTVRWTGKVGDASVFRVWGALSLVRDAKASKLSSRTLRCGPAHSSVSQVDPPPLVEPLEISSDSSGPAEGDDPAADDMAATRRSPRLETPLGFLPRPSSPPPQPASMDSRAGTAGAKPGGAETKGEGSGGVATGVADSRGAASPSGGGAVGDPAGGPGAGQPLQPDLLEMLSPQAIRAWIVRQGSPGGGGYDPAGPGATSSGGTASAGGAGGTAGGAEGAACTAEGTRGVAGAGGTRAASPGGAGGAAHAGGAGATSPGGATGAACAGDASTGGPAGAGGAVGVGGARAGGTGGTGAASPGGARTGGTGAAGAGSATGAGDAGGVNGGTGAAGGAGATGRGGAHTRGTGAAGAAGAGGVGGTASARGAGVAGARGAADDGGAIGAASAGGAGGAGAAGTALRQPFFYSQPQSSLPPPDSVLRQVLSLQSSTGLTPPLLCPSIDQSQPQLLHGSPLPAPAPHTKVTESLNEHREPETRASTPDRACHVTRPRPPIVPGTHSMALARAASPTVTRLLATSESVCPSSVGGEPALSSDVLEDRQFELECLAATLPRFASMLLCPEGDPDALDIPTPCSYAEAIAGEYSSKWQTAMDAKMASQKSTGTYIDEVPPPGANIVDGMWIFIVKRPPRSPPAFKARYLARGFSHRQGVDFFQTFSPTPKMNTL